MPFKDKKKRRKYMKNYMRAYRSEQAELKRALKADAKALERLMKIPKAYELVFGKQKKKKRKR